MAKIKLTSFYNDLTNWPGNLLHASEGVTIGTHNATTYSYTYLPGTNFAGFTVTSVGTGFAYDGTAPIAGTMTGLTIKDDLGHVVLSVSNIAAGSLASDFSLFAAFEFGWSDPGGGGTDGQTKNAWSQLMSGNDTITGTSGQDWQGLYGVDAGNDVYNMGAGDDQVNGGMGNDTIHGGTGWDQLDYGETHWNEGIPMVRGVTINVDKGTALDPFGFTDKFDGIEEFHGSATADKFIGGVNGSDFTGLRGVDTILAGTSGDDWALYQDDTWLGGNRGIVANLQKSLSGTDVLGTIRDGFGNLDRTVNLHNVAGTRYDDVFKGGSMENSFAGGEGKDFYNGGDGEDDLTFNWYFTNASQTGISVDLSLTTGQIKNDGFGNVEDAISIEGIGGSEHDDLIKGSSIRNKIEGRGGADTMTGNGGEDLFKWRQRDQFGQGDVVTDFHAGAGAEQDHLRFYVSNWGATTTLNLVNGTHSTVADSTFLFNATTHVLSWDEDGTGALGPIAIVKLTGVSLLTADSFELQ